MATLTEAIDLAQVLVERSARAGQMPPLHTRDEIETYRITDGRVAFFVDGDVISAGPGDVVIAPAGAERTFRAETDASWLVLTRVTSLDRYLDFGRALAKPLPRSTGWPSQDELASLTSCADANGIELLGPPGALPRD